MQFQRRKMIQGGISAVGLSLLPGCGLSGSGSGSSKSVIVVGAGVAGLAAARDLVNAGYTVTVIEAQDRIGGRLKTDSKTLSMPVDLGASWIHGTEGNPITKLAESAGATLLTTSYGNSILYDNYSGVTNQEISSVRKTKFDELAVEYKRRISLIQKGESDQSIYQTIWTDWGATLSDDADKQLVKFLISSKLETEYGGDGISSAPKSGHLSTLYFDSGKPYGTTDKVFAKGYGQISEYLASNITIKTSEKVSVIDYSNTTVSVTTDKGVYTADKVLVTVPLGVLKNKVISFTPALPTKHTDAIQNIGMGLLNKLYLEFAEPFWDRDKKYDWIESIPPASSELEQRWTEWVSFNKVAGKPILLGFSAATAAYSLEDKSDSAIFADAKARLELIFGTIPDPVKPILRTKWAQDPYTFGSYSFNRLGMSANTRKELAEPVNGKLFFAGEATSQYYFGTVHGAYNSGLDAAALIKA